MKNKIYWYYLLAIVPPFMGALSNIISKYSVDNISPTALVFYRWLVAVVVMTPFVIKIFIKEFDKLWKAKSILLLTALSGITLFNLFVYYAMHYTSSTSAAIIISMFPIFVMLFGFYINQDQLQMVQMFSVILSLLGAIAIVSKGNAINEITGLFDNKGDFLAIIATILYAIYTFSFRFKPSDISFYAFSYTVFLLGTLLLLPIYLFDVFYLKNTFQINLQNVSAILCLGIAVSIIGMLVFNMTILKLGYNLASIIFYLMPAFTAIIATLVLDEKIEYFHLLGMALILIGVNLPIAMKYTRKRILK